MNLFSCMTSLRCSLTSVTSYGRFHMQKLDNLLGLVSLSSSCIVPLSSLTYIIHFIVTFINCMLLSQVNLACSQIITFILTGRGFSIEQWSLPMDHLQPCVISRFSSHTISSFIIELCISLLPST